ncbi:MAG TPA: terminase large subunit [Actinoallomurus sp.]|nr:terminase large subunit [Actinoallomurus sp.]
MTVIDLAPTVDQPRVSHVPAYSTSAGDEAIDLAASAGLHLDPWQQFVLRNALGEREDGRWTSFEVGLVVARQQGKGSVLEARELAGLVLFGEKQLVHTAHELKTSMKHFKRLIRLLDGSDDLRKRVKKVINSNGKEGLEMVNGAVLECLARTKGAGRGYTGDLVVFDEAYALTDEQMEATVPTMMAVDNAQMWYTSSPPLDAESGRILMGVRARAEAGDDDSLAWFDYGLAGDLDHLEQVDIDDRTNWRAALPSMRSGRVREDRVVRMRKAIPTDRGFAREVLGIWPATPTQAGFRVISEWFWMDHKDATSEMIGRPALGVQVPPDRSYAAIVAAGARAAGGRMVEVTGAGEVDDYRPGTRWVVPRLLELEKHKPSVLVIDDKALADEAEEAGLVVHRANVADVVTGCQLFFDGIAGADEAGRDVWHLGQQLLTDSVAGADKRKVGNSWAWERHDATSDSTLVAAASLALFGHSTPRVHRPSSRVPMAAFA